MHMMHHLYSHQMVEVVWRKEDHSIFRVEERQHEIDKGLICTSSNHDFMLQAQRRESEESGQFYKTPVALSLLGQHFLPGLHT